MLRATFLTMVVVGCLTAKTAFGQAFGVEIHNTLMPASGGMGGASLALPQDVPSAINGNPATLTQYRGTHFTFSGAWVEPTYNVQHRGNNVLLGITPFAAKSEAQGSALGNIALTQDYGALGIPATFGIGLIASSGAGISFRDVPASNNTSATFNVLQITPGIGVDLTDRLSVGANLMLGNSTLNAPFVGISSAAYDYALRGSVGVTYTIGCSTTIGGYYQTSQNFTFDDAFQTAVGAQAQDVSLELPPNIGFGIANDGLLDGRLLLAADVVYKMWDEADLFRAIYTNQWALQFGAQYQYNCRIRLRAGYVYAENAMQNIPDSTAGGIPQVLEAMRYVQAQFAAINEHRMHFGVGIQDLLPGVDMDIMAGGMFQASEDFGLTSAIVESYWVGAGLTWKFGRGACERLPYPDQW